MELPNNKKYRESFRDESEEFIEKVEKDWRKIEKKILRYIANITNIKWKTTLIKCYVLRKCYFLGISDPLTIAIEVMKSKYKKINKSKFIDVLIHEVIHNLLLESNDFERYYKKLKKRYTKASNRTLIHIPVHAIHKAVYLKYFNEGRLNRDIISCSRRKDYAKAWNIVNKEGYENIIKDIRAYSK